VAGTETVQVRVKPGYRWFIGISSEGMNGGDYRPSELEEFNKNNSGSGKNIRSENEF